VTIHTDVPLDVDLESLRYRGASRERCYSLFSKLAFRSLMNEYAPSADTTPTTYSLVRTEDELTALAARLRESGEFAVHAVLSVDNAVRGSLIGLSFSIRDGEGAYVPFGHVGPGGSGDLLSIGAVPPQIARALVLQILKPVLEDAGIRKLAHDAKPVVIALARAGITLRGLTFDSMLASYLLDPTRSQHGIGGYGARASRLQGHREG